MQAVVAASKPRSNGQLSLVHTTEYGASLLKSALIRTAVESTPEYNIILEGRDFYVHIVQLCLDPVLLMTVMVMATVLMLLMAVMLTVHGQR